MEKMFSKYNFIQAAFFIFCAALFWQIQVPQAKAAPNTTLSWSSPSLSTIYAGDTFSVDAMINTGTDHVTAFDLYVTYDKDVLQLLSITPSSTFPQGNGANPTNINNTNGTADAHYSVADSNPTPINSTAAQMATFTFLTKTTSAGTSLAFDEGQTLVSSNDELGVNALTGTTPKSVTVLAVPTYTIGGSISGLGAGKSVVLQNNGGDDLTILADGNYKFDTALPDGSAYDVTVKTQPTGQICNVTSGATGIVSGADVADVVVSCSTPRTIGGTVSGLGAGKTVVLQNSGGDDLNVSANGNFTFVTTQSDNSNYSVTVLTDPSGQHCTVANGSGTVSGSNINDISVSCVNVYSITGTVNGLNGSLVLAYNGSIGWGNLTVSSNGSNTFLTNLNDSSTYDITIQTQPQGQTCTITNGSGTIAAADVSNVTIDCVNNPETIVPQAPHQGDNNNDGGGDKGDNVVLESRTIHQSRSSMPKGAILIQSGKRFSKSSFVNLYFSKADGSYYAPMKVKTNKQGAFYVTYKANKAPGKYSWYAVDGKSDRKSDKLTYRIK